MLMFALLLAGCDFDAHDTGFDADSDSDDVTDVTDDSGAAQAEALIEQADALLNGDPGIEQTPEDEVEELLAPAATGASRASQRRLARNHELALHAADPEPSWISTRASSTMVIASPGESHSVDLVKLDGEGNELGSVDSSKLRLELRIQRDESTSDYIPAEFQADYVAWDTTTPGQLNIHVPADLTRGRLLIGVRPALEDAGENALAERWSVPILVDVWPLKAGVITLDEADVYFPLGSDSHYRDGSAFDAQAVNSALKAATAEAEAPLKALVVKGINLEADTLIDYRLPDANGGVYPYGGRIVEVIEGSDGQQLLLVNFEVLSVYDILLGADDQFVKEGVLPEFVTYRSGPALPAEEEEGDAPLTHYGPEERATIQGGFRLFGAECSAGGSPPAFAVTPYLTLDVDKGVDAGLKFSLGVSGAAVSCTVKALEGAEVPVPLGGPIGAVLQKLLGTGVTVGPYGEVKLTLSGGSGFTDFRVTGGYSVTKGLTPPSVKWNGSLGSGLEATPITAKAQLGGELGMKGKLAAADVRVPWLGTYDVSLTSTLGWFSGLSGEALNAAAAKNGSNSALGMEFGAKFSTKVSAELTNMLQWLGAKSDFKFEYKATITKKVEAGYRLFGVNDDAQGHASATLQPNNILARYFSTGATGSTDGYTSLDGSSVYNDPNDEISYDLAECESSGGNIVTPLVACIGGFFCGQVNEEAKLCGGSLYVTPVSAIGKVGDTVSANGEVSVLPGGSSAKRAIELTGDPLVPQTTSFELAPGESAAFTATASCESRGVFRGAMTASAGADNAYTGENLLTCKCSAGSDCDRLWGDPYLLTPDGLAYDYIASGDYILQQVVDEEGLPIEGLQVQARFLPGFDVSWPYSSALQVGDDTVEITPVILGHDSYSIGMEVRVNGEYLYPPAKGGTGGSWAPLLNKRLVRLPGGGLIFIDAFVEQFFTYKPARLTVIWPADGPFDGYGLQVSMPEGQFANPEPFMELQFIRPDTHAGRERGMMGNNDGDPSNDFMRRNGDVLGQDAAMSWTALYALFGGDWLVRSHECLFSDGCVTPPDFPTTAVVLTPEQRALGEAACSALTGFYREACIHDVGLSGSVELVQAYYANTTDLNEMAALLQTPDVDLAVYTLDQGEREDLPEYTPKNPAFRLGVSVTHVSGEGNFLLTLRPPRGASASFSAGFPGALNESLIGEGDLATAVDVQFGQPDPEWSERMGEAWPRFGALQLWSLDPLSGFANGKLSEIPLYPIVAHTAHDKGRLAGGWSQSYALDRHGQPRGWGADVTGPVALPSGVSIVSLDASSWRGATALDSKGRVWEWEKFSAGVRDAIPKEVNLDALGGTGVLAIKEGNNHGYRLFLDQAGRVWMSGALCDSVTGLRQLDLTALGEARVMSMAAGWSHALLLDDTGQLWAWGSNGHGELGNGTTVSSCTLVAVDQSALGGSRVVDVGIAGAGTSSGSGSASLALDESGRVWAWGQNVEGILGPGAPEYRLSPGRVQLPEELLITRIAASVGAFAFALDDTGQLWGWGNNDGGQMGIGSRSPDLPSAPTRVDQTALGAAKVVSMATGYLHALALDSEGRLWAWGWNGFGALGNGTGQHAFTPERVDDSALGDDPWRP